MAGDIYARVQIEPHKVFQRKGADLFIEKKISLLEALTGYTFEFKHLDGKKVKVTTCPGDVLAHNSTKTIKGQGMPFFNDKMSYGHLFVKFEVVFPKRGELNEKVVSQLKEVRKIIILLFILYLVTTRTKAASHLKRRKRGIFGRLLRARPEP